MDRPPVVGQEIVQFVQSASAEAVTLQPALVLACDSTGSATIRLLFSNELLTSVPYTRIRSQVGSWCFKQGF
jgi:hypothetical protein